MIHLSKLTHFSSALMTFVFAQIFLLNCEVGYGAQANDDKSEASSVSVADSLDGIDPERLHEGVAIDQNGQMIPWSPGAEASGFVHSNGDLWIGPMKALNELFYGFEVWKDIGPGELIPNGHGVGTGGLSDVGGRSEVGPRHWSEMREHRFDRAGHAFESSFKEEISVRDFRSQINFDKSDARLNLSGLGHGLGSSKLNFKSFQSIASFESSLLSEPLDISVFDSRLDDEALKTIEEFSGYLEANAESSEVFDLRASPSKMSSGLLAYARDSGFQVGIETGARVA
ncbi:MAG: hypothetical protein ACO3LE_10505, partial [Bdellovibrionota bacterium]